MEKESYQKIYYQLLKEHPHNIDAFEKLAKYYRVDFEEIILNKIWNEDEKARLLRAFGHNKEEYELRNKDDRNHYNAITQCLTDNNETGFKALVQTFFDIKEHYVNGYMSKEKAYRMVVDNIRYCCKDINKQAEYLAYLLEHSTEEWLEKMFVTSYSGHYIRGIEDENIIKAIIETRNIDLIKKHLHRVSNTSLYLSDAVRTGDKEIVQYFLDKGADINYIEGEPVLGILTPLKAVIQKNNYEMYQFLIEKGANPNLRIEEPDLQEKIINHKIEIRKTGYFRPIIKEFEPNLSSSAKELIYIRSTSPLEYAYTLGDINFTGAGEVYVYYGKSEDNCETCIHSDKYKPVTDIINRQKIIDDLYLRASEEELEQVDYNMLLHHSLLSYSKDSLIKYIADVKKYNKQESINVDELVNIYVETHRKDSLALDNFIEFIDEIDPKYNVTRKLLEKCIYASSIYLDEFTENLLDRLSEEERKDICLMPYCKDIETCKKLIEKGFDINQANANGNTLLIKLMSDRLRPHEQKLVEYVVENADLSIKNNDNKNALFYAIKHFNTKDEFCEIRDGYKKEPTFLEKLAVKMIDKMNKKDVRTKNIAAVLEWRHGYENPSVDKVKVDVWQSINPELVYTAHRDLFKALKSKGVTFSKNLLREMITELKDEDYQEFIDKQATKEFVFEVLDHNTEVHRENLIEESEKVREQLEKLTLKKDTYEQVKGIITEYNEKIGIAKNFRDNILPKKANPDLYLEYVKEKYGIDYNCLDEDAIIVLIGAIRNCDNLEQISELLDISTNINLHSTVDCKEIDMSYWEYVAQVDGFEGHDENDEPVYSDEYFEAEYVSYDDFTEKIQLLGGLMQYAILTNNVPFVKLLQDKGLNIEYIRTEDEEKYDYTFHYVNSHTMKKYIESQTAKRKYNNLINEEVDLYESLISEEKPVQKKKTIKPTNK